MHPMLEVPMSNPVARRYAEGIRLSALAMGFGLSAVWFLSL
jgi:hypothetical protein